MKVCEDRDDHEERDGVEEELGVALIERHDGGRGHEHEDKEDDGSRDGWLGFTHLSIVMDCLSGCRLDQFGSVVVGVFAFFDMVFAHFVSDGVADSACGGGEASREVGDGCGREEGDENPGKCPVHRAGLVGVVVFHM